MSVAWYYRSGDFLEIDVRGDDFAQYVDLNLSQVKELHNYLLEHYTKEELNDQGEV